MNGVTALPLRAKAVSGVTALPFRDGERSQRLSQRVQSRNRAFPRITLMDADREHPHPSSETAFASDQWARFARVRFNAQTTALMEASSMFVSMPAPKTVWLRSVLTWM